MVLGLNLPRTLHVLDVSDVDGRGQVGMVVQKVGIGYLFRDDDRAVLRQLWRICLSAGDANRQGKQRQGPEKPRGFFYDCLLLWIGRARPVRNVRTAFRFWPGRSITTQIWLGVERQSANASFFGWNRTRPDPGGPSWAREARTQRHGIRRRFWSDCFNIRLVIEIVPVNQEPSAISIRA